MDQQLLREFLADAEDLIELLSGDTEALRAARRGRERRALTGRIFRHVHTLKGAAASVELEATVLLAHEFESLLDGVRLGRVRLDDAVMDTFADATLALGETLLAATRGETAPPAPRALLERLRELAQKSDASAPADLSARLPKTLPEELARSLSAHETQRLTEATEEGAHLLLIHLNLDLATFDQQFRALEAALAAEGEIISTSPWITDAAPGQLGFRLLYATEESAAGVASRVEAFGAAAVEELAANAVSEPNSPDRFLDQKRAQEPPSPASLLRVEPEELDEAIHAAHELFKLTSADSGREAPLEELVTELRSRSFALQERLIALRMVPVARTLRRARRAGLLAARLAQKEIEIELTGEDVLLDKSLADLVSDPLLQLVRNAVDHGIEAPAERAAAGKSARGLVRLEALAEGSRVRLRVSDDGRGLDPERLTRAAREQGIIAASAQLDMRQAMRLIFRPGFSTAAAVSSVSGRGVGLDVVERSVERAGGELRVRSEMGVGTTFEILLPTTLALVHTFLVQSGGQLYCLDASHVADACLVEMKDEAQAVSSSTYGWRGESLPLYSLRDLLGQPPSPASSSGQPSHVVIASCKAGGARTLALAVDGWEGYRRVLVRGLGRHAPRWHGIGGATELDDGGVALLLDLPRLLDQT